MTLSLIDENKAPTTFVLQHCQLLAFWLCKFSCPITQAILGDNGIRVDKQNQ